MRVKYFENHKKLSDYMTEKMRDGFYIVTALFYKDAVKLIRELMMNEDVIVDAIEVVPPKYDGYDREYYVSLTGDNHASVEPAYVGDRYLSAEADLILVDGNANSSIIKELSEEGCREIYIGENENFESEDTEFECGNYYNNRVSKEIFNDILDNPELIKDKKGNILGVKVDFKSIMGGFFDF